MQEGGPEAGNSWVDWKNSHPWDPNANTSWRQVNRPNHFWEVPPGHGPDLSSALPMPESRGVGGGGSGAGPCQGGPTIGYHQQRPAVAYVAAVTTQQFVAAPLRAFRGTDPKAGSTYPSWMEFMNRHLKLLSPSFPSLHNCSWPPNSCEDHHWTMPPLLNDSDLYPPPSVYHPK